jgi:hypothetical protein
MKYLFARKRIAPILWLNALLLPLLLLIEPVLAQPARCVASALFYDNPGQVHDDWDCLISWNVWPNSEVEAGNVDWYPMLYNKVRTQETGLTPAQIEQIILDHAKNKTVLMLNECDAWNQCNMTPGAAADWVNWWRDYLDPSISVICCGVILHTSSVGGSGNAWMWQFVTKYLERNGGAWDLQGVHFHIYPDSSPHNPARNTSAHAISDMQFAFNYLPSRGLPSPWQPGGKVFFSEIGCLTSGCASYAHMQVFADDIRDWIDTFYPGHAPRSFWYTDYYAPEPGEPDFWWTKTQNSNGTLTPVGQAWRGDFD